MPPTSVRSRKATSVGHDELFCRWSQSDENPIRQVVSLRMLRPISSVARQLHLGSSAHNGSTFETIRVISLRPGMVKETGRGRQQLEQEHWRLALSRRPGCSARFAGRLEQPRRSLTGLRSLPPRAASSYGRRSSQSEPKRIRTKMTRRPQ